jgi:hypothetical protein
MFSRLTKNEILNNKIIEKQNYSFSQNNYQLIDCTSLWSASNKLKVKLKSKKYFQQLWAFACDVSTSHDFGAFLPPSPLVPIVVTSSSQPATKS